MRGRVRHQLDDAADDPDLPAVYEYVMCAGVGYNSCADDLLDVSGKFVDSKPRRLRFTAFGNANAMCEQAQWVRVARIKQAYR